MKVFYSDRVALPLPQGHRFPAGKYPGLQRRVIDSGLFAPEELIASEPASDEQLLRVHTSDYVQRVTLGELSNKELRRIGFPWSPEMVERSRRSVGATIAACRAALIEGIAANLAGGTHHAYPDHGEGYCVFNDVAVASRSLQAEGRVFRIVILDCDVHQGNGTAAIFSGDESVFTFSVHGQKNFPFHKELSDLDIALPDGATDGEFLDAIERGVRHSIDHANAGIAIYLAGADPFIGDTLGRMAVSKAGLAQRDRLVLDLCRSAGLPVAITMAGGYAKNVEDIVDIHFETLRIARSYNHNLQQM
jgi:acetoin utilization deacetylase AcuC-like enzyme